MLVLILVVFLQMTGVELEDVASPRAVDYKKEGVVSMVKARGGWLLLFFVGLILAAVRQPRAHSHLLFVVPSTDVVMAFSLLSSALKTCSRTRSSCHILW